MSSHSIRITGVPIDLGQQRRGVSLGPGAVRYAGLGERLTRLGHDVHHSGNITAPLREQLPPPEPLDLQHGTAHYVPQIAAVCQQIYDQTVEARKAHERVIFLGGDHSLSIGTVAAVAHSGPVGVVWVDAHADINTPLSTPSGNIHGMALAILLGDGPSELTGIGQPGPRLRPDQVALVGIRDLDPGERERLRRGDIAVHTMQTIDRLGMATVADRIVEHLAGFERLHVSLDLDALDPDIAPGVGTPVPGGLTYREAHLLMEILAASGKVRSLDIVEINPILDDHNQTAGLAVELAASLFGQTIL